uniref:Uncharacterized protein n=1 Tax=Lactuca sativa TaxID=4236 RepID=A0A9R1V7E4_LACSA|nr:hypothetical protein LSAT_V11C600338730 [Lactuca sativa]
MVCEVFSPRYYTHILNPLELRNNAFSVIHILTTEFSFFSITSLQCFPVTNTRHVSPLNRLSFIFAFVFPLFSDLFSVFSLFLGILWFIGTMGEFQKSVVCRIASLRICCFVSFLPVGVFYFFVYFDVSFLCSTCYIVHLCDFCCQSTYSGMSLIPCVYC